MAQSRLVVPATFNRNAVDVQTLGKPEQTGKLLMEYMAERLGLGSLADLDVLDFGCGCRFSESIINLGVPIKSYFGIDVYKELMDFLAQEVRDPRFEYRSVAYKNARYNKDGEVMGADTTLPCGDRTFDVICMFSVITHQDPTEARATFRVLRHYVRPDGRLFFSAAIEEGADYHEKDPANPGALSIYSFKTMKTMLEAAGWEIVSHAPRNPRGLPILDSFLCKPVAA